MERARSLGWFRLAIGLALAAHFVRHLVETVPLLAGNPSYEPIPIANPLAARGSWLAQGLSPEMLHALFGVAVLLALALGLGIASRVCAASLLAVAIFTYWAVLPVAFVDDQVVIVAAFAIAVLPTGAGPPGGKTKPRDRARPPAHGGAVIVLSLGVLTVYASGSLGALSGADPSMYPLVTMVGRGVAIAMLTPNPALRLVGLVLQVGLHGYLAVRTPAALTNAVLAATCLLLRDGMLPRSAAPIPWRLDAGGATAAAFSIVWLLAVGSHRVGLDAGFQGPRHLIGDIGLLPLSLDPRTLDSLIVTDSRAAHDQDGSAPWDGESYAFPRGLRQQLLAAQLASSPWPPMRLAIAQALARRHCRERGHDGLRANLTVMDASGSKPIVDFGCGPDGALAYLGPWLAPAPIR
jgi:hypothetical protein